ncbi:MAG TPA: hypothetical protein HA257_02685 [Candidatus Methanoperedenaceae archaeon]|nr:hypothetical protein [Candidatus Methanoperedenaceae archaeon]
MPHKCTRCEKIFKDGAAIILNGCPACGWNKFLYVKEDTSPFAIISGAPPLRQENQKPVQQEPEGVAAGGTAKPLENAAERFIIEVNQILEKDESKPSSTPLDGSRVESIRIVQPGSYELNLGSLMQGNEIVMALKEDGTYVVHLPSVFDKHVKKKGKKEK